MCVAGGTKPLLRCFCTCRVVSGVVTPHHVGHTAFSPTYGHYELAIAPGQSRPARAQRLRARPQTIPWPRIHWLRSCREPLRYSRPTNVLSLHTNVRMPKCAWQAERRRCGMLLYLSSCFRSCYSASCRTHCV